MFSLISLVSKVPKTLFIDLALSIINNRIGMSMDEMVNKVSNRIIDKMGTLISHNG